MSDCRQEFVKFALRKGVIRFGDFKTKAGRMSPYFFNAGLFSDGESLGELSHFYAQAVMAANIGFDMLFGPAYKGIPLVAVAAVALAAAGRNYPFCFDRKETKDHGEGGTTIGAPLQGRVLIVDDVISAGTSVRQSVDLIRAHGAAPAGVMVALDRMERGSGDLSAVEEVSAAFALPVISIATLDDLIAYMSTEPVLASELEQMQRYRERYGTRASR
jgi:orotate phosphoribosyltransferase